MARKIIQLCRGLLAKMPKLREGEIVYSTDAKHIYIGTSEGNKEVANYDDIKSIVEQAVAELKTE